MKSVFGYATVRNPDSGNRLQVVIPSTTASRTLLGTGLVQHSLSHCVIDVLRCAAVNQFPYLLEAGLAQHVLWFEGASPPNALDITQLIKALLPEREFVFWLNPPSQRSIKGTFPPVLFREYDDQSLT